MGWGIWRASKGCARGMVATYVYVTRAGRAPLTKKVQGGEVGGYGLEWATGDWFQAGRGAPRRGGGLRCLDEGPPRGVQAGGGTLTRRVSQPSSAKARRCLRGLRGNRARIEGEQSGSGGGTERRRWRRQRKRSECSDISGCGGGAGCPTGDERGPRNKWPRERERGAGRVLISE